MIEQLYESYFQELVRWCRTITNDTQTAEELVQEAFLRAMLHEDLLGSLKENQRRSWLYRTVKNLYVDRIRHLSREDIVSEVPDTVSVEAFRETPAEMAALEWQSLLDSLPDMEGVLFFMRYVWGYNSRQIGELFSLPPGTVRSKLSSARKHLKQALGGHVDV